MFKMGKLESVLIFIAAMTIILGLLFVELPERNASVLTTLGNAIIHSIK